MRGSSPAIGALTPDPYDPAPDLLRVRHVYVRPLHRGAGIGRVLAAALIQQGLDAGAAALATTPPMPRASAFWEATAFAPDSGRHAPLASADALVGPYFNRLKRNMPSLPGAKPTKRREIRDRIVQGSRRPRMDSETSPQ